MVHNPERYVEIVGGTAIMGSVAIDQTTPGTTNGVDIGAAFDNMDNLRVVSGGVPAFGTPTLFSQGMGKASWDRAIRTSTIVTDQKSTTGWLACLNGGVQTSWDDAAALYIPVNEMLLPGLTSALWSYFMNTSQSFGCQMSIWVHDPTDNDKRGDIIQLGSVAGLEKTAGWDAHELNLATSQFFFYAEGESGNTTCTTEGAANLYTLAEFQADPCFSTWTVYRISFNNGFENSGTFQPIYVADVKINEQVIPLGPTSGKHNKTVVQTKLMIADAKDAGDVVSESAGAGTDWDFAFGGTGKITQAVITHDAAITNNFKLYLFTVPPTGMKNDNVANSNPLTADAPYYRGSIDFMDMSYVGTGDASAICTTSTSGNLPIEFDSPMIYGVLVTVDGVTLVAEDLTITLTARMED